MKDAEKKEYDFIHLIYVQHEFAHEKKQKSEQKDEDEMFEF